MDDPVTLEDLAVEFGVSRERVRQIEVRALEKVQRAVKDAMVQFRQAASQAVDFGAAIQSVAPPMVTSAAHHCGTGNSVKKENDTTNTTKLTAKPAVAISLIGSLAFSAAAPSLAQPGSAYQTRGNNDSMGCPC
jgi:hypothetical protein